MPTFERFKKSNETPKEPTPFEKPAEAKESVPSTKESADNMAGTLDTYVSDRMDEIEKKLFNYAPEDFAQLGAGFESWNFSNEGDGLVGKINSVRLDPKLVEDPELAKRYLQALKWQMSDKFFELVGVDPDVQPSAEDVDDYMAYLEDMEEVVSDVIEGKKKIDANDPILNEDYEYYQDEALRPDRLKY